MPFTRNSFVKVKNSVYNIYYGAHPELFRLAVVLRKHMTPSELLLWERLKGKQLGFKFRRQHPIGQYIADFYCHKAQLVVEIDGGYHLNHDQIEYDLHRDDTMNSLGLRVLRYPNGKVLNQIDIVLREITTEINARVG
jgi:cyclase